MDKKTVFVAVAGVAVLALAYVGFRYSCDCRRNRADRRADECLHAYFRIVGDGRRSVPADRLGPVLDEMASLSDACSKTVADVLFARRLDGAFLLGDYARAEKMIDGMPGKSANWREGIKAKIRAHAALERGDNAAAIAEFEAFCQAQLREDPDGGEYDPWNGVKWSREGLLALNKKRMSGLAAGMGDAELSARLLEEARKYAAIAMEKAAGDEESKAAMAAELGSLVK